MAGARPNRLGSIRCRDAVLRISGPGLDDQLPRARPGSDRVAAPGATVEVDPEFYPNGRFARLTDPESNPIQLWQPWGRGAGDDVAPEIDLFFRHIERFNAGVRSGDFGGWSRA